MLRYWIFKYFDHFTVINYTNFTDNVVSKCFNKEKNASWGVHMLQ